MIQGDDNLLDIFKLPANTKSAVKYTLYNGKKLDRSTLYERVGTSIGDYKLGVTIEVLRANYFHLDTYTVEDGVHQLNSSCYVTASGKLLEGTVNVFALGYIDMDQGYVDELLKEYKELERIEWDEIKT